MGVWVAREGNVGFNEDSLLAESGGSLVENYELHLLKFYYLGWLSVSGC